MKTQDNLIQQALLQNLENEGLNETQIENTKDKIKLIEELVKSFNEQILNIKSNGDLSNQGQATQIDALRLSKAAALEQIVNTNDLDTRINEIRLTLVPSDNFKSEPAVDAIRQMEIRNHFYKMDELEIIEKYLSLAVDGQSDEVMRAIENSPIPLITDATILEKGKQARAERQSPETRKQLTQLILIRSTLQSAKDMAIATFGIRKDSDILKMASGQV